MPAVAESLEELELEELLVRRQLEVVRAGEHPAELMRHMVCLDKQRVSNGLDGHFRFCMDTPDGVWDWRTPDVRPEPPWSWQRQVVDGLHEHSTMVVLKARQLGATWIGCGYAVWLALYRPGSLSLLYRQKKDDAERLIYDRCTELVKSLPDYLLNRAQVRFLKGSMEFLFPDGNVSRIFAESSSSSSGRGETVGFVLLDEFAFIDNAPEIMRSVSAAAGRHGRILVVSTANGTWDPKTNTGNYFAGLWKQSQDQGLHTAFLPWWFRAERTQEWFETSDEVQRLQPWERKVEFPGTPAEAFEVSDACYFDKPALSWYASKAIQPALFQCHFDVTATGRARLVKTENDWISVFKLPDMERRYAIGADVASGHGLDFSAAYVVDLSTMELCAEFHGRLDEDQYAEQLHYLGRWYGRHHGCVADAVLAIERGGGFGNATVISLTDGRKGRPPYSNLYRHREHVRVDHLVHKNIGFPMTAATRMPALENLESCVREKALPWLTDRLHSEMGSFVRYDPKTGQKPSGTWPRAMQGTNDDLVMAAAITLELYRERGHHPEARPRRPRKRTKPMYPWNGRT